jgi:uncharacterized protein YkwD
MRRALLFTLCAAATFGAAACLSGLSGGALFVDEPDLLSDPDLIDIQGAALGAPCASSQNCQGALRCVRRGDAQTCEATCAQDGDCAQGACRPVLNDDDLGWCGPDDDDDDLDSDDLDSDDAPSTRAPSAPSAPISDPAACQDALAEAQRQRLNRDRRANGLRALCCHPGLASVARGHSQDMARRGYFDHTNPDGEEPWDRMQRAGVSGWTNAAENIAYGYDTPDAVQDGWLNSPGHRANIMDPGMTHVGVGVGQEPGGARYWTQLFATFPSLRCDP